MRFITHNDQPIGETKGPECRTEDGLLEILTEHKGVTHVNSAEGYWDGYTGEDSESTRNGLS